MGIYINIAISTSVTQKEWEAVYEETLKLIDAFPLAEKRKINIRGIDAVCLTRSKEREIASMYRGTSLGWWAVGDYTYMHTAEDYVLRRNLVGDDVPNPDAGDAIMCRVPAHLDYEWNEPICNQVYELWGNKSQGEPYHIYLLAIACLIEDRLGEKAYVYGDITRGQCIKAVDLANEILSDPIQIPARCDVNRFRERISKLPLKEAEKVKMFECCFLGTKDANFGAILRSEYSKAALESYWATVFKKRKIGTLSFDECLSNYLTWGFEFEKLCGYVNFTNEDENLHEKFVKRIMDAKLHIREKNCKDLLNIDQDEAKPYTIATLFAQFAFMAARNKRIDRYIPIDEIRRILCDALGDKCDVNSIIDEYLEKEAKEEKINWSKEMSDAEMDRAVKQDASEIFTQIMDHKRDEIQKVRESYDVSECEHLLFYEAGDSMRPDILKALTDSFLFYQNLLNEEEYGALMKKTPQERFQWLIARNRSILIRDGDWEKIFMDIEQNEEAFARYYPSMRVKIANDDNENMMKALILNDALYDFCKKNYEDSKM